MDNRVLEILEYHRILEMLASFAATEDGKKQSKIYKQSKNSTELFTLNERVREFNIFFKNNSYTLPNLSNIRTSFVQLKNNHTFLEALELLNYRAYLITIREALLWLDNRDIDFYKSIDKFVENLIFPEKSEQFLLRAISTDGKLTDASSMELLQIRQSIRRIQKDCTGKVNNFLKEQSISDYLQNDYLTIIEDRYVLAVKANFKGQIKGIVHDFSRGGETCYIEPYYLIELNNNLRELRQEEQAEELKILREIADILRMEYESWERSIEWLIDLDIILAKIAFAKSIDGIFLDSQPNDKLELKSAKHPFLIFSDNKPIPIDIILEQKQSVLLISGSNAGGKTIALKTLAILSLMILSGLPVPVDNSSSLPYFTNILLSMGDEQSLDSSLSTFTAQVDAFARNFAKIDKNSLVILDEFGTGTDPSQGAALAQAVLDALLEKGCYAALATHFPALKIYALSHERVRAACVLFDPKTRKPKYLLSYDQIGSSQALDIARQQGMPEKIIQNAQNYLIKMGDDGGKILQILNELAVTKQNEIQSLEKQRIHFEIKYNKQINALRDERAKLAQTIHGQIRNLLNEIKIERKEPKKVVRDLEKLRETLRDKPVVENIFNWSTINIGMMVLYIPWEKPAIVKDINEKKQQLILDVGNIKVTANLNDVADIKINSAKPEFAGILINKKNEDFSLKIDVRGLRAQDALDAVQKFIDEALLRGAEKIEVIHGKGNGILRTALHNYLRQAKEIKTFAVDNGEAGGDGVTIISLP